MLQRIRPIDRFGLTTLLALSALCCAWVLAAGNDIAAAQDKGGKGGAGTPSKVGLVLNSTKAYQGYTLFTPLFSTKFYLMDMEGKVVKSWEGADTPSCSVYLLPNGNLLRPCLLTDKKAN